MKKISKITIAITIVVLIVALGTTVTLLCLDTKKSNEKIGQLENQIKNSSEQDVETDGEQTNKSDEDNNINIDETKLTSLINTALIDIAKKDEQNSQVYYTKYFELGRNLDGNMLDVYVWSQYGTATENNTEESGTSIPIKLKISLSNYSIISNDVPPDDTYYPEYFPEVATKLKELDGKVDSSLFGKTYYDKDNNNQNTNIVLNNSENSINNLQKLFIGKYSYNQISDDYYHKSDVTINNMTTDLIKFSINTAHGRNVDNVNIGEVSGIAQKISVPADNVIPESEQLAYEFKETKEGKTSSITFVFTQYRMFTYLNINEKYEDDFNPYAGHNVYFAGEYEKTE